jgi:hypothetical protein
MSTKNAVNKCSKENNITRSKIPVRLFANDAVKKLDALAMRQEKWSIGLYKKSNDELYSLLAECYDEVMLLRLQGRGVVSALNKILAERGISFNDATKLETKVVRVVFGNIGKRAFSYSSVLVLAKAERLETKDFATWITNSGGVEEVRKKSKLDGKTPSEIREDTVDSVSKALSTISAITASDFEVVDGVDFSVVIVRKNADGSTDFLRQVKSQRVIKDALISVKDVVGQERLNQSVKSDSKKFSQRQALLKKASNKPITLPTNALKNAEIAEMA